MKTKYLIVGALLLALALVLAACAPAPTPTSEPTSCPEPEPCPSCPAPPEPEPCAEPIVKDVPFEAMWAGSGHADFEAEAFNHWNEDDPQEIPTSCAKCHSTPGYVDFLGADGTEAFVVDNAAPTGTVITCAACHNDATLALDSVTFPSGAEVTGLGAEARCMQCHQGRASKSSVDSAIEENGLSEDLDKVGEELGFINIHYFAAGATLYGTGAKGGYEYDGKSYDYKNDHVAGYDTCVACHNPHTLEVKVDECAACHTGVTSIEDVRNIRMNGSKVDYDGDGDVDEPIRAELEGLRAMLMQAIQTYASEVSGTAIVYDAHSYPYFFIDSNANGEADEGEAAYPNKYNAWTGRLLKAAYNYQTATKDPGAFAHGGKYIIELLYDSIEDLNSAISTPVDLAAAHRIDAGHFAGSEEAFRHFDEDGEISGSCARCHSAEGLPTYLKEGVNISTPIFNGLKCSTCHDDLTTFTRYEVGAVTFPSGAKLDTGDPDSNLCMNCHQGRQAGADIGKAITSAAVGDDEVSEKLSFRNPHYFAAGATLFGADAAGAYEYAGNTYAGRNTHVEPKDTCVECHSTHGLTVKVEDCGACHANVKTEADLEDIRFPSDNPVDYDGDGDATEGIAGEVETMHDALYTAIQAYAADTVGTPIVYNTHAYPYFFTDTNANGVADPDEANYGNKYASWTPRLLRAAYNYQWVEKDPGAFAHNGTYMLQVLYDSLNDLGAAGGMTRP